MNEQTFTENGIHIEVRAPIGWDELSFDVVIARLIEAYPEGFPYDGHHLTIFSQMVVLTTKFEGAGFELATAKAGKADVRRSFEAIGVLPGSVIKGWRKLLKDAQKAPGSNEDTTPDADPNAVASTTSQQSAAD